jgi:hypothetical protein
MENVNERRKEQQLKYVSKALTCQCPKNISDMFKLSNSVRYELSNIIQVISYCKAIIVL